MKRTWKRMVAWLKWHGWLDAPWYQQRQEVEPPYCLTQKKLLALLSRRAKRGHA